MNLLQNASSMWRTCMIWCALKSLRYGPFPKHVSFIMDGNRRWATKLHMEKKVGHTFGFMKLREVFEWCYSLGITTISVYAFSIENFKRRKDEVDALMDLARTKFKELLSDGDLIKKYNVSVRVLGDISLLPPDVQQILAQSIYETRNNTGGVFNVCVSYTSREEMSHSMRSICNGITDGLLAQEDITEELFEECLYDKSPPDVLVRTSGERRLSDFLLWQSSFSCLVFTEVLWPDYSLWDLYKTLIIYQQNYATIMERRTLYEQMKWRLQRETDEATLRSKGLMITEQNLQELNRVRQERQLKFLEQMREVQLEQIRQLAALQTAAVPSSASNVQ